MTLLRHRESAMSEVNAAHLKKDKKRKNYKI